MLNFDKAEIKNSLTIENIFELLQQWGGDPMYTSFGIISATICHNPPGEGSRKLYYYTNSNLFQCYTGGCEKSNFDIFELTIKVFSIQNKKEIDLNEAVRWIAGRFGLSGSLVEDFEEKLADWDYLTAYERL
mgnify:CR=1 FL=1